MDMDTTAFWALSQIQVPSHQVALIKESALSASRGRKMLSKVIHGFCNTGWQDLNQEGQSLVLRLEGNLKWGVYWEICIYKEAIYYT